METQLYGLPLTFPPGWELVETRANGQAWFNKRNGVTIIRTFNTEADGHPWCCLSVVHTRRCPRYQEILYARRHWLGARAAAIILPVDDPKDPQVTTYCVRLFSRMDGPTRLAGFEGRQ